MWWVWLWALACWAGVVVATGIGGAIVIAGGAIVVGAAANSADLVAFRGREQAQLESVGSGSGRSTGNNIMTTRRV